MLVVLTVSYFGYNKGAQDGWWRTMVNGVNTQNVSYQFGYFLGSRYKNVPNIVWEAGVDTLPPEGDEGTKRSYKILEGIKAAGDSHLWTGHWVHDYLSTDSGTFNSAMDIEGVYTHGAYPALGPTYARARLGYSKTPARPTVLLETTYENEHNANCSRHPFLHVGFRSLWPPAERSLEATRFGDSQTTGLLTSIHRVHTTCSASVSSWTPFLGGSSYRPTWLG